MTAVVVAVEVTAVVVAVEVTVVVTAVVTVAVGSLTVKDPARKAPKSRKPNLRSKN